ncbi:MAG: CHAT domain-containing protein [Acidobacteria bacterium]|nr:CHAT domain-containing protein [Acidobacteriota bacterium]
MAWQLYVRGDLAGSQRESERGYERLRTTRNEWAARFQLLAAEVMVWRGMYDPALSLLSAYRSSPGYPEGSVLKLALEAVALTRQAQTAKAEQRLASAEDLCRNNPVSTCGNVFDARGILAVNQGKLQLARQAFLDALAFEEARKNRFRSAIAKMNIGWSALQSEHYDDALDWLRSAQQDSKSLGAEEIDEKTTGNLGWAYYNLGDGERARDLLLEAQKSAKRRGSIRAELGWTSTIGYVHQSAGDLDRASVVYQQALSLAEQIDSKQDIINTLEDLAYVSIDLGQLDKADAYLDDVTRRIQSSKNHLDVLDVMLARARIAAAKGHSGQSEGLFRSIVEDPSSQTSMRLEAEHGLALLFESEQNFEAADRMYRTALATFEQERDQLRNEDSRLPFGANAEGIYDDYIDFLVKRRKSDEALILADQSRARALAQGLGLLSKTSATHIPHPSEIARKTGSTLLFYWVGAKQSYLWAITPNATSIHVLPSKKQISDLVSRYSRSLRGFGDPLEFPDSDGRALFQRLVAPASASLDNRSNVIVLADGALSQLNFETLIVPSPQPHYWIEDATISSAPSLQMLASAHASVPAQRKLLLIGDAISPGPDYPNLPMAAAEMKEIQQRVGPQNAASYSREQATPAAYLGVAPQQFSYIHFVAHGVASSIDPLDSAIILSRSSAAEDSFKLHARDIIQHPIRAEMVTISACYGSGNRIFAGEGSIGLAWAFLRAGAHNVIGALWEVSDESEPQMMGDLYRGLYGGLPPSAALRQAKLAMLHSKKEFRKPFYWAPMQIYTGL